MKLDIHGGGCGHSCCLRVENLSVRIGSDSILKDVNTESDRKSVV